MSTLIAGIGQLVTHSQLGTLRDAAVVAEDGVIVWVGPAAEAPGADRRLDVGGRAVTPGFVDSHTHLVFAGERSAEFVARMRGTTYDAGGIASTVEATARADDAGLESLVAARVSELRAGGTTTVEIKSGYGLSVEAERRLIGIAARHTTETTFLGAHVVPPGVRRDDYLAQVTGPMLAACAPNSRWIDVFCEPGSTHAFDEAESRAVLLAGRTAGLGLRVHANQLGHGPGVRLAVELGAASADHCTHLTAADIAALADGSTVATLLPAAEFCSRSPYPPARQLLDAGVTVALATDCNPGTAFTSSMPFVIALAVRELGMTPEEALWSATRGGAMALQRNDIGLIEVGARADLTVVDGPSFDYLAYRPGMQTARALEF